MNKWTRILSAGVAWILGLEFGENGLVLARLLETSLLLAGEMRNRLKIDNAEIEASMERDLMWARLDDSG